MPFLAVALPYMALIAALAVVFETVPWLRGAVGNVVYFFVWIFLIMVWMLGGMVLPFLKDPMGYNIFGTSLYAGAERGLSQRYRFLSVICSVWRAYGLHAQRRSNLRSSTGPGWTGPRASSAGSGCGRSLAWD